MQGAGFRPILVHGGGPVISEWLQRLGKEPVFVNGLRQTDAETLEVAVMVLAGKVNKDLVAVLQGAHPRRGPERGFGGLYRRPAPDFA